MRWVGINIIFLMIISCTYSTEQFKEGKRLFDIHCSGCHGHEAEGLNQLYPSLKDTTFIYSVKNQLPCIIRKGIHNAETFTYKTRHGDMEMPENNILNAIQICNILNYANSQWWHSEPYALKDIELILKNCK
ncbi:MAG: c-type cytochrome [Saprospiraceae bacterium]|jgi:mono/diheme cytochrome c family protein|nr:c-type cytochrome [Saprospiraceae bacterium]